MSSIEVVLEKFSVLFLYSCILMSLLQIIIIIIITTIIIIIIIIIIHMGFRVPGEVSSYSRLNSSSSITPPK